MCITQFLSYPKGVIIGSNRTCDPFPHEIEGQRLSFVDLLAACGAEHLNVIPRLFFCKRYIEFQLDERVQGFQKGISLKIVQPFKMFDR